MGPFTDLTSTDFAHRGIFGYPGYWTITDGQFDDEDIGNSDGAITGLRIGGDVHLFTLGDSAPGKGGQLHELIPPATLATTLADAIAFDPTGPFGGYNIPGVRATWVRRYGAIGDGHRLYQNSATNGWQCFGLQFVPGTTRLVVTYFDTYQVIGGDPACFMTELDTTAGTFASYGPFRTNVESKLVNGYVVSFPDDIATTYLGGRRLALGGLFQSGGASAPQGCYLRPMDSPTPATPANEVAGGPTDYSLTVGDKLFGFDVGTPMPEPIALSELRVRCGWADPGIHATLTADVAAGATTLPVSETSIFLRTGVNGSEVSGQPGVFYGYFGESTAEEKTFTYTGRSTTSGAGDLTGVSGVLSAYPRTTGSKVMLGKYDNARGGTTEPVLTIIGPRPVSDPNNVAFYNDYISSACVIRTGDDRACVVFGAQLITGHVWYGPSTCAHDQVDEATGGATGPGADKHRPCFIFYSLSDVIAVANGTLNFADIEPIDFVWASDWWDQFPEFIGSGVGQSVGSIAGMWFDDVLNDLYISFARADSNANPSGPRPAIFVTRIT